MKRMLFAMALSVAAATTQPQGLSTQTGTVAPLITPTEDTAMWISTGYKAYAGDLVQFMAFGDSAELTYCAIYDYWSDFDSMLWEGWSNEIPVITIPYGALWSLLCFTKAAEDHYILDRAYVLAAVKHVATTAASLSVSEMASEASTRRAPDPAMQAALYRALNSVHE